MELVSTTGASSVTDPDHGTIASNDDGLFDVPEEFARKLLAMPGWVTRAAHEAAKIAAETEALKDPAVAARILGEMRDEIGKLRDEVTKLRRRPAKP